MSDQSETSPPFKPATLADLEATGSRCLIRVAPLGWPWRNIETLDVTVGAVSYPATRLSGQWPVLIRTADGR